MQERQIGRYLDDAPNDETNRTSRHTSQVAGSHYVRVNHACSLLSDLFKSKKFEAGLFSMPRMALSSRGTSPNNSDPAGGSSSGSKSTGAGGYKGPSAETLQPAFTMGTKGFYSITDLPRRRGAAAGGNNNNGMKNGRRSFFLPSSRIRTYVRCFLILAWDDDGG